MKIWKRKIEVTNKNRHSDNKGKLAGKCSIPNGVYEVREARDDECTGNIAPISHGFVNLYQDNKFIGWCGVSWAERRIK